MDKLKLFIMKKKMSIIFMITLEQSIVFLPPFFFILLLYFLFFYCKNKSCSSVMGCKFRFMSRVCVLKVPWGGDWRGSPIVESGYCSFAEIWVHFSAAT